MLYSKSQTITEERTGTLRWERTLGYLGVLELFPTTHRLKKTLVDWISVLLPELSQQNELGTSENSGQVFPRNEDHEGFDPYQEAGFR